MFHFQPKDLDTVEAQRLERIQAAKRIRRSKSAPSSGRSGSVGAGDTKEEETTSCLPNIFKMQQKSDKHQTEHQESCAEIPSPISDPPPYESVGHDHNENTRQNSSSFKNYQDDCSELRDESTAPLLEICEQTGRSVIFSFNYICLALVCEFSLKFYR